jgi:hypothetical protein
MCFTSQFHNTDLYISIAQLPQSSGLHLPRLSPYLVILWQA